MKHNDGHLPRHSKTINEITEDTMNFKYEKEAISYVLGFCNESDYTIPACALTTRTLYTSALYSHIGSVQSPFGSRLKPMEMLPEYKSLFSIVNILGGPEWIKGLLALCFVGSYQSESRRTIFKRFIYQMLLKENDILRVRIERVEKCNHKLAKLYMPKDDLKEIIIAKCLDCLFIYLSLGLGLFAGISLV